MVVSFVRLAGRIPFSWIRVLGGVVGAILSMLPLPASKVTELNLKLCFPELSSSERRRLLKRSLQHTAGLALEIPRVWSGSREGHQKLELRVEGLDLLTRALERGRGTILLAPHIGNWEILGPFLMARGQLVALYRPPRIAELHELVRAGRERSGSLLVEATPAGMRPLLRSIRSNHMVMVLPDQEPFPGHGVHAAFFGQPAFTMTLVSGLLRKTGAEALFVFTERLPGGYCTHFVEAPSGLEDADPERAAARLNAGVEACVRLCPEQYQWSYKRFFTAPPGEPTPYRAIWSRRKLRRNPFRPQV